MMFPLTWEENVAFKMEKIPLLELTPGVMVKDLYKAYRAGLDSGRFPPWSSSEPDDRIIPYISSVTGKGSAVVLDFLTALEKAIKAGKAPADAITGKARTGVGEKTGKAAVAAAQAAKWPLTMIASVAVVGLLGYLYLTKKG